SRFLRYLAAFTAATTLLGGATLVGAQGITSEQAQQILDELKAIRKTLEQRPGAPSPGQPQAAQPQSDKVSMAVTPGCFSVGKDVAEGTAAGVGGTPSFVLGRVENGKLEGVRLVGAMPYTQFEAKIKEMLAQAAKK